ncbi:hypothetical protein ACE11A_04800 [Streptomyces carpaticus]|uniref:HTH araC/xylS-type domain-containing protein n=1 Tax=Streptomyces carpaticus TaxID=285558 RepID=A0ABV4ZHS3_9ACTN
MLRESTLSISASAAQVGIPDLQACNKACRRDLGASPQALRAAHRTAGPPTHRAPAGGARASRRAEGCAPGPAAFRPSASSRGGGAQLTPTSGPRGSG